VVGEVIQGRTRVDGATFVGKGMIERIGEMCKARRGNLVIFDHDLRPAQARNIEEALSMKVIDRSELILDIFALRARTRVARRQVELAQLEYMLPRLRRLWVHLSRLGGGIGTRGPGETQLETDRRLVTKRIATLRKRLASVETSRETQRKARERTFRITLVGYTNAGKSSLLNRLTGANVRVEDELFSTLDATTRRLKLEGGRMAVATDTVGFIRKLPHHLILSFHATLEEVVQADLLIHVIDVSTATPEKYIGAVNETLEEIGASSVPTCAVFNKIDLLDEPYEIARLSRQYPGSIFVSCVTGEGIDDMFRFLNTAITSREEEVTVMVPRSKGRVVNYVYKYGNVEEADYVEGELRIRAKMEKKHIDRLRKEGYVA
jgi:GTP-binding protein HflX